MSEAFYQLLFRPGEKVCFSADPYGTRIYSVEAWDLVETEYFTINPVVGGRKNDNVTAFRNFLVEFDKMPLEEQFIFTYDIGLPYSTCVFSGGKSYHFIISLADDLEDIKAYQRLKDRIFKAVGKDKLDSANGNPSRLSRRPGAWRLEKRASQELVSVGKAIEFDALDDWLNSRGATNEQRGYVKRPKVEASADTPDWLLDEFLSPKTKFFLENGAEAGDRHRTILRAAFDFKRVGFSQVKTVARLYPIVEWSGIDSDRVINESEVAKIVEWAFDHEDE